MGYFTENLRELERMRQRSQANIDKATGALDKQNKAIDKFATDSKKNSEEYKAMMKKKMAESGMFGAVELESCFVLEGEQADAYKANKAAEKEKAARASRMRDDVRQYAGSKNGESKSDEDRQRERVAKKSAKIMMKNTGREMYRDYVAAKDAANRHMRRHPEKKVSEALDMLASIDYPYNG